MRDTDQKIFLFCTKLKSSANHNFFSDVKQFNEMTIYQSAELYYLKIIALCYGIVRHNIQIHIVYGRIQR